MSRLRVLGIDGEAYLAKWGKLDCLCHPDTRRSSNAFLKGKAYAGEPEFPAFLCLGEGVYACSAALTLMQLSSSLELGLLSSVASELEGTFARDPVDPVRGEVAFGLAPFAETDELLWELARLPSSSATSRVGRALGLSGPNAWSPLEAVLATLLALPGGEGGYDLGPIMLNRRVQAGAGLPMTRTSRVPDIEFRQAPVCLNYDGEGHLDLRGLESAAMDLGSRPGDAGLDRSLRSLRLQPRRKYVDDRRRERDLAASGRATLVVTKEDLLERGAMDLLAQQLIILLERSTRQSLMLPRQALADEGLRARREKLLSTLLFEHP
ncbi:hypothetical protein HMPREF1008_01101 [Olsenella sp. oral taxon 809 str. F0356]|uniref:hypothetical protein n=1 Tax=Olsenella sp. oral taxon 809 TaxID=661086 RepID=UPI000231EDF0|nr:hypothetical protein [Olsenella sp. oral taxon 809]EHF02006.1 hypothetical protein HMPREF1008_01101 [Olsenella sp. oral taxon 809 str. F0356]